MFAHKVVVVTGGAQGIGKTIAEEFRREGAEVCVIDVLPNPYFVGDLADPAVLESFARKVTDDWGRVDVLVNNAPPLMKGIDACSYEEFDRALRVGVAAPFYLCKLFRPWFAPGASVVNISSSRDRMSQPQTESYTAAKGGISALTHALAVSLAGKVRVNSISPDGSTRRSRSTRGRTHISSPPVAWETRWTSRTWCCISAQTRRGSSPARTSASTAA